MRVVSRRRAALVLALSALAVAALGAASGAPAAGGTTIVVTRTDDPSSPTAGQCSLREAVSAANTDHVVGGCPAGNGADTIVLGAANYSLTLANTPSSTGENLNVTGDLDITAPVTIRGQSATSTYVDASVASDRAFDIQSGVTATIENLHVLHGGGFATQA